MATSAGFRVCFNGPAEKSVSVWRTRVPPPKSSNPPETGTDAPPFYCFGVSGLNGRQFAFEAHGIDIGQIIGDHVQPR